MNSAGERVQLRRSERFKFIDKDWDLRGISIRTTIWNSKLSVCNISNLDLHSQTWNRLTNDLEYCKELNCKPLHRRFKYRDHVKDYYNSTDQGSLGGSDLGQSSFLFSHAKAPANAIATLRWISPAITHEWSLMSHISFVSISPAFENKLASLKIESEKYKISATILSHFLLAF